MTLQLQMRPFSFSLLQPLRTATGVLLERRGWLLQLCDGDTGALGWGEIAPLRMEQWFHCQTLVGELTHEVSRDHLEALIHQGPGAFGFGLGAALAELDGLVGVRASQPWQAAPPSAQLLPAGEQMLMALDQVLHNAPLSPSLTLKWKVATEASDLEQRWLKILLARLPSNARLRLDANGGWDRFTAGSWMELLRQEPRFDWLEQPLAVDDHEGLEQLAQCGLVALDESLEHRPELRESWLGWQVRRPAVDGDPRPLLRQIQAGVPRRMVSTAFETGIARRWLHHLAALQWVGPTPAAPGLAPGWCPAGPLFSADPQQVWAAAAI
jgi:O-succinylbenzoate synthase